MSARLNLVVAHKLEATALVSEFGLIQESSSPLVYGDEGSLRLIVSGEGSAASAAAVHYVVENTNDSVVPGWLNIGIAGHQSMDIGQAIVINKLVQSASGAVHYPIPMFSQFPCGELHTVDAPEFTFGHNVAYDMEGFGFYSAAIQHTTMELVQCFKIISDNRQQDANSVNPQLVREIFAANMTRIKALIAAHLELLGRYQEYYADPIELVEIYASMHLTATQRVQVRKLVQRFHALNRRQELAEILLAKNLDGRNLVKRMAGTLREVGQ